MSSSDSSSVNEAVDSSSDSEIGDLPSTSKITIKTKPKKPSFKKFNSKWLADPLFKDWLARDSKNEHLCKCLPCNVILKAGKSDLKKHITTKKHGINIKGINKKQQKLTELFAQEISARKEKQEHEKKVKTFELMLSVFFAEHNAAFLLIDHLIPVLQKGAPDSKIIADMRLKRTKCTNIVKRVLGAHEKNQILAELQQVRKY